jgi:hypothetical protein
MHGSYLLNTNGQTSFSELDPENETVG